MGNVSGHAPLGARPLEEKGGRRVKQLVSLLSRFLPLLHRAKYFHGKKVNGEIEISGTGRLG